MILSMTKSATDDNTIDLFDNVTNDIAIDEVDVEVEVESENNIEDETKIAPETSAEAATEVEIETESETEIGTINEFIGETTETTETSEVGEISEAKKISDQAIITPADNTNPLNAIVDDVVTQLLPALEQQLRTLVQQALQEKLPKEIIDKLSAEQLPDKH